LGRRRTKGAAALPFVMGQGRQLWDAVHADAHTWGGKVTVTNGKDRADRQDEGRQRLGASANPRPARATSKVCGVCTRSIRTGQRIVPKSGIGKGTVWAHKECVQ
jgi:hypothetical protein